MQHQEFRLLEKTVEEESEVVSVQDAEFLPNTDEKRVKWYDDEITEAELEEKNKSMDGRRVS